MRTSASISGLVLVAGLAGCATPVKYTSAPMGTYDKNTDYSVTDREDGFTVDIRYARYQFIPESGAVGDACKAQATALAWEIARKRGRAIDKINDQEVRVSMGRNGFSGITSCTANVPVYYKRSDHEQ